MHNYFNHSLYLTEQQRTKLNTVINEEMTINNNVSKILENIIKLFNDSFKTINFTKVNNAFSMKKISFNYKWENAVVFFNFKCYNVFDKKYYNTIKKLYNLGNGEVNETTKTITINLGYISGTLQTPLSTVLRHEEQHIFQILMGRQINNWHMNDFGKKIYLKAVEIIKKKTSTIEDYIVAFPLYTQSDNEVDAFINQLYQELVENNIKQLDEDFIILNSSVYKYYLMSKKYLRLIKNDRTKYEPNIIQFGLTFEKYIKMIDKALNRTIQKIGKVIVKYNKDYPLKGADEIMFNDLIDRNE